MTIDPKAERLAAELIDRMLLEFSVEKQRTISLCQWKDLTVRAAQAIQQAAEQEIAAIRKELVS